MRKSSIRIIFVALALAISGYLVWGATQPSPKETPCEESMEPCCNKKSGSDPVIWETLSGQFFTATGLN